MYLTMGVAIEPLGRSLLVGHCNLLCFLFDILLDFLMQTRSSQGPSSYLPLKSGCFSCTEDRKLGRSRVAIQSGPSLS